MIRRSAESHGYARLTTAGLCIYLTPGDGSLLFVDLDISEGWDQVIAALRAASPSLLQSVSKVIFKSPRIVWSGHIDGVAMDSPDRVVVDYPVGWPASTVDLCESLRSALKKHRLPVPEVGVLEIPIGADVVGVGVDDFEMAACRAVELEAFLETQGGIWRPSLYHYELPSGQHARSFVRVADALRDPAAPSALASWLRPAIRPTTAVVIDSGSIMPIISEVDTVIRRAAQRLPIVDGLVLTESIDRYPRSRFEMQRRLAGWETVHILALLSVSSSGRSYRLLKESLRDTTDRWRAERMVERGNERASALPPADALEGQAPWLSIDIGEGHVSARVCSACRNQRTSRVVHIDPRTFAAMALPGPALVLPDYFAAIRNASLFNAYRSKGFSSVQLAGSERTRERARPYLRPDQPERIRFEPISLLTPDSGEIAGLVGARVDELRSLRRSDTSRELINGSLAKISNSGATVVVCDAEELTVLSAALQRDPGRGDSDDGADGVDVQRGVDDGAGDVGDAGAVQGHNSLEGAKERFLAAARAVCPTVRSVSVVDLHPGLDSCMDALVEDLKPHDRLLLTVAGLQTGVTLQHLVVAVQEAYLRLERDPSIAGLVLHAHPVDGEAWASVRNSFGGRSDPSLLALWLTYLPGRSPFANEFDLLRLVKECWYDGRRPGVKALVRARLGWLNPERSNAAEGFAIASPLWSPRLQVLRRTSIYGALDDRNVLPAVGAALAEKLDQEVLGGAPGWVAVDMAKVLRSYFDGLLHAAVMRWVSPELAWWGADGECSAILGELKGRFAASDDWELLLPEMLLAAAQGKLPDDGVAYLLAEAKSALNAKGADAWPPEVLDFVDLGQMLVDNLWMPAKPEDWVPGAR